MSKIGFVGAGKIGANAVYATLHEVQADEMALVDLQADLAAGEALDLNTAAAGLGLQTKVRGGDDYELLSGSDLVVVSAGVPRTEHMTREDLIDENAGVMATIAEGVQEHAPDAKILVVTNPVDPLTYITWEETGWDRSQVFGMGALHDSMRLWDVLRDDGADTYDAWVLGPHGEDMFPAQSQATVEGVDVDWDQVEESVRGRAANIIEKKGATYYAPGIAIAHMAETILGREKRVLPVVSILEGEYGLEDVALGVPAVLSQHGVERVIEVDLDDQDRAALEKGAKSVRSQLAAAGY
jgi:malate dehydrogenase